MTAAGFRRIALALDAAVERAHHGHPDFRVGSRVFATLGYPDRLHAMVGLTPEQQRTYLRDHPQAFTPVKGKWGDQGATLVRLSAVDEETLGETLTLAWQNAAARGTTRRASKRTRKTTRAKRR
jgi:hypothetical protein